MAQMSQVNLCISLILSPEKETTTTWNFHSSSSVEIGHRPQGETLASALSGPRYPAGVRRTRLRHFLEKQEQDRGHRLTPVQEKAVMCSDSSTREGRTNELSVQLLGCQTALHTYPIPPPRPLQAPPLPGSGSGSGSGSGGGGEKPQLQLRREPRSLGSAGDRAAVTAEPPLPWPGPQHSWADHGSRRRRSESGPCAPFPSLSGRCSAHPLAPPRGCRRS